MRESELEKRRKAVEELLQWHRKLTEEEKRIAALENTVDKVISKTPNVPCTGDQEKHKFQGKELNRIWYNLTGSDDRKFVPSRVYQMPQIALERFCKSAREYALKNVQKPQINETDYKNKSININSKTSAHNIPCINQDASSSVDCSQNKYSDEFEAVSEETDMVDESKSKISSICELIDNFSKIKDEISNLSIVVPSKPPETSPAQLEKSSSDNSNEEISIIDTTQNKLDKSRVESIEDTIFTENDSRKSISDNINEVPCEELTDRSFGASIESSNNIKSNIVVSDIENTNQITENIETEIKKSLSHEITENLSQPKSKSQFNILNTSLDEITSEGNESNERIRRSEEIITPEENIPDESKDSCVLQLSKASSDNLLDTYSSKDGNKRESDEQLSEVISENKESSLLEQIQNDVRCIPKSSPRSPSESLNDVPTILESLSLAKSDEILELESTQDGHDVHKDLSTLQPDTLADEKSQNDNISHEQLVDIPENTSVIEEITDDLQISDKSLTNSVEDYNESSRGSECVKEEEEISKISSEKDALVEDKSLRQNIFQANENRCSSFLLGNTEGNMNSQGSSNKDPDEAAPSIISSVAEELSEQENLSEDNFIPIELDSIGSVKEYSADFTNESLSYVVDSPKSAERHNVSDTSSVTIEELSANDKESPVKVDEQTTSSPEECTEDDFDQELSELTKENCSIEDKNETLIKVHFKKAVMAHKEKKKLDEQTCKNGNSINVKKRVSEILAEAAGSPGRNDKSPRVQDLYVTTYDLSPGNSPESGSPLEEKKPFALGSEAEELLKKQLAIEQEIKQITEQQQKQSPSNVFIREIPNKPPPPYTPPSLRTATTSKSIIPATQEEMEEIVKYSSKILIKAYHSNNLSNISISDNTLNLIAKDINKDCFKFVFDVCKEFANEHYSQFNSRDVTSWLRPMSNPKLAVMKPFDVTALAKYLNKSLAELFRFKKVENPMPHLMKKKPDHVDEVLVLESRAEESLWTNFDQDELEVLDAISKAIMSSLLDKAVVALDQVVKQKFSNL